MRFFREKSLVYSPIETRSRNLRRVEEPRIGFWHRISPTLAILFTNASAIVVWSIHRTHWKNAEFYALVANQRVGVQVLINVISSLLTVLWTWAVCCTINMFTRSLLVEQAVSLNTLRQWTLLSQGRLSRNLPFYGFILCASFYGITVLPAWLWTGALTPQIAIYSLPGNATLPKVGMGSYSFLNFRQPGVAFDFECREAVQANGTFTSCPGRDQTGLLLQSASSATTIDESPRNHSKYDNTPYRYSGRSYGAGSSVGLATHSPDATTLDGYNYTENGYRTTANCIYNTTSLWEFGSATCESTTSAPCVYFVQGCFPNSQYQTPSDSKGWPCSTDFYAQVALNSTQGAIVAMGATNSDNLTDYYLAIAARSTYTQLSNIQCQFFFEPTQFAVNVTSDYSISVTPMRKSEDPEPRGMLRSKTMDALNTISMVQTTLYKSTVGDALMNNVQNYIARVSGVDARIEDATPQQVLTAVTDSMEAMADDILASFAAYAFTMPNATELAPVDFTASGVEIGELPYIIATAVYQFVALVVVVGATIGTRFWSSTPAFDYADIGAMSTAAFLGGNGKNKTMVATLEEWQGNPEHHKLGTLRARYLHSHPDERPSIQISAPVNTIKAVHGHADQCLAKGSETELRFDDLSKTFDPKRAPASSTRRVEMSLDAKAAIRSKADTEKPLIHHLTADNSWLLQIPRRGRRPYFNILLDPWLDGSQIQDAAWFHEQSHTIPSAAQTMADVERFLKEVESRAVELRHGTVTSYAQPSNPESFVDAVAISMPGTDHCNENSLTQLPKCVPILVYGVGTMELVKSWNHFEKVVQIAHFTGDWRDIRLSPLPDWMGIGGLSRQVGLPRYFGLHLGIVVSFKSPLLPMATLGSAEAECVLYMPHGVPSTDPCFAPLALASPRIKMLAVIHTLLRVLVGGRLGGFYANLGAHNALEVARMLKSRYLIPTHDEPKKKQGFTKFMLTDDWITLDEAAAEYAENNGLSKTEIVREANLHELENGGSLVLV